jgi:hypothetical protein
MPIYEYYCPQNHTIYQFYAKTLAQGKTTPPCPDNPAFALRKVVSSFAITSKGGGDAPEPAAENTPDSAEDARLEAAMGAMEQEFSSVDENDPQAMARMMRRMSELAGEEIDGEMEEVVRKLEEGADPESLEERFGGEGGPEDSGDPEAGGMGLGGADQPPGGAKDPREKRHRFRARRLAPRRDPRLHDYP